eukprot:snap_masked-scaffold_4-processed-gene-21.43-mRNA-1 protein AED:1.00 eAED:1.00 QI:0/-1/0/0/-1/1/1/0/86
MTIYGIGETKGLMAFVVSGIQIWAIEAKIIHYENLEVKEGNSGPFDPKSEKTRKKKTLKIENSIEDAQTSGNGPENSPERTELEVW